MYLNFYGFKEKPFNLTPDSHFLFLSEKHKEALAHIRYGIEDKKGFILITGEIGSGKTTLCRAMFRDMNRKYRIALILNSMVSAAGLLKSVLRDLGIVPRARGRQDMMDVLYGFLISGKGVIIVIDEAQNLGIDALEQVRLLGNMETEKEKLLQIILVGQPELRKKLEHEKIRQLSQRIAVRYHISPLNREETADYISHRIKTAGGGERVMFHKEALQDIYNFSGGIPRVINILCDYSLVSGFIHNSCLITKEMVREASGEMQGIYSPFEVNV